MGLRERLQGVAQFFQKAATRGHELRQEEHDAGPPPSAGEQSRDQEERGAGEMMAEDRTSEPAAQQRDPARQA